MITQIIPLLVILAVVPTFAFALVEESFTDLECKADSEIACYYWDRYVDECDAENNLKQCVLFNHVLSSIFDLTLPVTINDLSIANGIVSNGTSDFLETSYIDELNRRLVIWLKPGVLDEPINYQYVKEKLNVNVPVEFKHGILLTELKNAHSTVTDFMIQNSQGILDEDADDIHLVATFVDETNQKLVIWLDPISLFDPLDNDDLQEGLGVDVLLDVKYGLFSSGPPDDILACPTTNQTGCYVFNRFFNECGDGRDSQLCYTMGSILNDEFNLGPPLRLYD